MRVVQVERGPLALRCAFNGGLIAVPVAATGNPTNVVRSTLSQHILLNVFRNENYSLDGTCCITFQFLSPEGQVLQAQAETGHLFANCLQEDPRLFVHNGQLFLSYNRVFLAGAQQVSHVRPGYCPLRVEQSAGSGKWRVDVAGEEVLPPWHVNAWEKNWMFFEHKGALAMAYSIHPLRILHADTGAVLSHHEWTHPQQPGLVVRGGAPPVLVEGLWYFFNHTLQMVRRKRLYHLQIVTVSATTLRVTAASNPLPVTTHDIVFPVGAVYVARQQQFLVTCGVADREQILLYLPLAEVRAALLPVA